MSSVIPYIFMITFSSLSTVNKLISTSEKQDPVVRKWLYTTCYAIINICSKSEKILFFFRRKNKLSKREKKKEKEKADVINFYWGERKKNTTLLFNNFLSGIQKYFAYTKHKQIRWTSHSYFVKKYMWLSEGTNLKPHFLSSSVHLK